jgi:hypothetical protein
MGHPLAEKGTATVEGGVFRMVALNQRLSKGVLDKNLGESLRAMYNLDISVLALAETNAPKNVVATDEQGLAERSLDVGGPLKFLSLWSFMPEGVKAGSGTTLIWDARIPHQDPFRDKAGRLAAVTLMGPTGAGLRVIAVYGYSNPHKQKLEAQALRQAMIQQILLARKQGLGRLCWEI